MIETGVFDEDDRIELLAGTIVKMSPQGRKHARIIQHLNRLLVLGCGDRYVVRPQLPLTLDDEAEPEPDLAVVPAQEAESVTGHPSHGLLHLARGTTPTYSNGDTDRARRQPPHAT